MTFLIADSFTSSLARLTPDEQAAAKASAFDLQQDRSRAGMSYHALGKAKDARFASVRVNDDLRVIVHRTPESLLLCYVGHHDDAYRWAERRKLDAHPTTGAMQMVEVRERVENVVKRVIVAVAAPAAARPERPLFAHLDEAALLAYGVPLEWVPDAQAATETTLFDLAEHLPAEAADALLTLAVGEVPEVVPPAPPAADPFAHPAAQRRFRVVDDVEALATALDAPWEQWAVFLHPSQRDLVERDFGGPARVSGSAGTGKTVVALHRAAHLAERDEHARVLLATFSDALARHLDTKLRVLTRHRPRLRERLDVATLAGLAARLHRARFGRDAHVVDGATLASLLADAARATDAPFAPGFLANEWDQVVDAWQLRDWEAYRAVPRLGRKVRFPESARARAWAVFERVWAELDARGLTTEAAVYQALADAYAGGGTAPYAHVVLDEAQDASAAQLRFLAQLVGGRPNGLFFAGDLGQRIFQQPFSWLSVGVDVRGRARTLKVNYRTSHQIRTRADRLLDARSDDVDGETQDRRGTISVFDGPEPRLERFADADAEARAAGAWLAERVAAGARPHEVGVFVRHEGLLHRAHAALAHAGLEGAVLDGAASPPEGRVAVATMHRAKGLEYRAVAAIACDEDALPLAGRLAAASDMNELQEVHETERHLLYVALTRARDDLWVSGVAPGTDYLADL